MFRLLFLCAIAITFSYCNNDKPNSNGTNTETAKAGTTAPAANNTTAQAAPVVKKNYEASHEAPFCKLWVVTISTEAENPSLYKGLWFDLKGDGSFESGKYQEKTNFGTWSIAKETNIISLLFNTAELIPSNWQIQGAGGGGRILWKGNVPGNPKGLQVVLESDTAKPSK